MAIWKETMQDGELGERPVVVEEPPRMSPILPRRESILKDRQESVLGTGVTIEGKIDGDGDMRIAGKFKGDIHIKGVLNIEKGAHIAAKINAETVTIGGELEGNVVANAQVKLLESGQLIGDLKAPSLTVAAGSRMRGNVEFGWNESEAGKIPSIRSQEKGKNGAAG
jgi:cytoskeletal protein CcmA (bactofilin family)